ncbi:Cys/Met metabolism PLP-dependent enzyme superfamily protein, partial [Acanthamoeba castellanii str. Neff]
MGHIVIESGTKYLSGKGDVLLGDVVFRKKQADQGDITQRVKRWRSVGGGSPTPMSCWLVSKGLETLRLRMHHATATALEVARFLETVPCLSRVVFPGLASHPCHTRAVKYFGEKNSGAVLRFHICLYGPTVDQMLTDPHPFMHAREVPDYVGYWFRVAIGLETAEDIISGFLHELVTKVGEVKKFDAKTRQLSFRGKLPSPCPYLFFFAGESDGGKGQKPPSQSTDGQ